MLEDLIISGYRYADLSFVLPQSLDPEKKADMLSNPALVGLKLRDYVLDGGRIGVEMGQSNHPAGKPEFWYTAQCHVLPEAEHTEDSIGTLTIEQRTDDDTVVDRAVLVLEELDNGHVLDRLRGEAIALHVKTLGEGPHTAPGTTPKRKRKP